MLATIIDGTSAVPLRFTIRDLLWLTVVAALAVGWWLDHHKMAADSAKRDKYAAELAKQWTAELRAAQVRLADLQRQIENDRTLEKIIDRKKTHVDNMPILAPPIMTHAPPREPAGR
jgi:hypothetical protein